MSRVCDLTGHSKLFGHKVSHSNRKTKRTYLVNLHNVKVKSDLLGCFFKFKVSARTLRTIDFKGGFDSYLLNTSSRKLSTVAQKLKGKMRKKMSEALSA